MDSFWQQHRSFILKAAAGVFVFLVCLIILGSLNDKSVSERKDANAKAARTLSMVTAPSQGQLGEYRGVVSSLSDRVRSIGRSIGYTSGSAEPKSRSRLRRETFGRILRGLYPGIERDSERFEQRVDELLDKVRSNPIGCVVGLKGEAVERLLGEAARRNVRVDEELGFGRETLKGEEVDRYLVALDLIVRVVSIALDEDVFEIGRITIESTSDMEVETGDTGADDYDGSGDSGASRLGTRHPVTFVLTAPSPTLLSFLERIIRPTEGLGEGYGNPGGAKEVPAGMIALKELSNFGRSSRARREEDDLMEAKVVVMSLQIDLGDEGGE